MQPTMIHACRAVVLTAFLASACTQLSAQSTNGDSAAPVQVAPITDAQRKLAEYTLARQQYDAEAEAYWTEITEKRRARFAKRRNQIEIAVDDYVLTQPPVYSGPPKPAGVDTPPDDTVRPAIPVVADFLQAAAEHFDFVPRRPPSEIDFKRAYAQAAAAAGLTKDQVVRIYGFESGGNGKYDVQAGLEYRRAGAKAISTALGYNQLLTTNTVSIMAVHGDRIVKALAQKAARLDGAAKQRLATKIATLQRMVGFARTVPVRWSQHEKLAKTPQGLGLHALNLDIDVGPLLQTQKLLDSVVFAKRKGIDRTLSAAELEMMNLTGDGNGFDIVAMPPEMRGRVPTSNFFRRGGYQRNPVVARHNVVARLLAATEAKMDRESSRRGARDLAAVFSE